MLHTKFQGHRPFGSGEEDFLWFLPYMGMAAILVMWPWPFEGIFVPSTHTAPHKIWLQLAQWLLRRRYLKMLTDRRGTTYDRSRMPTYIISSPMSLRLRWAKNTIVPLAYRCYTWNLVRTDFMASEMSFENVDGRTMDACLSFKLTRIRNVYWWHVRMTIIHQDQDQGD